MLLLSDFSLVELFFLPSSWCGEQVLYDCHSLDQPMSVPHFHRSLYNKPMCQIFFFVYKQQMIQRNNFLYNNAAVSDSCRGLD